MILERFQGDVYLQQCGFCSKGDDDTIVYPVEYLIFLNSGGFPPSQLTDYNRSFSWESSIYPLENTYSN
jgi:hypothetical protein